MAQSAGQIALDIVMGQNTVGNVVRQAMSECQSTMNDSSASISTKTQAIGTACTSVGAAMMPVSTAVAGVGKAAISTAADFDSKMSEVSAISGATGGDLDKLRSMAKKMGSQTKFSASESADAMKYMGMAGWNSQQMIDGLPGILNLAASSGESLGTTSDIVTDAMTGFGLSADKASHFADVLAATSTKSNTNVSLMGETFKYIAPVAGALGYSVEDTSVAIGLMANAGIKGSQAGTSLRGMLTNLAKPSDTVAAAMDKLGISLTDEHGKMYTMEQLTNNLRQSFSGLTEAEKAKYAASLAGKEGMSGLLAIVNASEADYNKLSESINNCNGRAQDMADTMQDNLNGQITTLKSQLEGVAITIGETLMPIASAIVGKISDVVTWFSSLDSGIQQVIIYIGLAVAAIGPVLLVIGKVITTVGKVMSVGSTIITFITGSVMPALSGFFSFLLANPIVLVIAAIIAIGVVLITHWDTVKQVAGQVWQAVCDFASAAASALSGILNSIGQFFVNCWNGIKAGASSAWNGIKNLITTVMNTIKTVITTVWNTIKAAITTVINAIKTVITTVWNAIKAVITTVINAIKTVITTIFNAIKTVITTSLNAWKTIITTVWNAIKTVFTTVLNAIKTIVTTAWNAIKTAITTAINAIKSVVTTVWNAIKTAVSTVMNAIKNIISTIWNGIGNLISNVMHGVGNTVSTIFNNMKNGISNVIGNIKTTIVNGFTNAFNFIKNIPGQAFNWGKDMIAGIVNGIKSMIGAVGDAVGNVANKIKSLLHFSRPDAGPLREYETWMPDFMQGLATGITGNADLVTSALGDLTANMTVIPSIKAPELTKVGSNQSVTASQNDKIDKLIALMQQMISNEDNSVTIPVYIGNELIDEYIQNKSTRKTVRSGGFA